MRSAFVLLALLTTLPTALADPVSVSHKDATNDCPAYTYVTIGTRDVLGYNVFLVNDDGTTDVHVYFGSDDHPHRGGTSPFVPDDNEVCAEPNETPDMLVI
ncbi:MAG: hypothetical protein WDA16_05135 [Candidatus Thermoplasmatota archaeon]